MSVRLLLYQFIFIFRNFEFLFKILIIFDGSVIMFHLLGINFHTFILQLIKVEAWVRSHLLAHDIEVLSENQVLSDWGICELLAFLHLQHGGVVRVDRVSLALVHSKLKLTLKH